MNLTTDPIPRLVRQIAIPASIGFFFNTMYNVVDTWYASISDATFGQAALTFSFPVFMIILSLSSGLGTGANVLVSNAIWSWDQRKAQGYIAQWFGLIVLLAIIGMVVGTSILDGVLQIQNASGQAFIIAKEYLVVIVLGLITFLWVFFCNSILNAQGDTKSFRNALITGFFLNFVFNSLFLFGWLGIPGMHMGGVEIFWDLWLPTFGIAGIALSTIIIELLIFAYLFYKVTRTPIFCKKCFRGILPNWSIYKEYIHHGAPASFNMMTVALGILIIQAFVWPFGDDAIAAYGIATRIEQVALLPTIGLNIAAMSLIWQNNGAKKYDRVKLIYKTCLKYGAIVVIPMMVVIWFWAEELINVFPNTSAATTQIGSYYLRIALWLFVGYVALFVSIAALQGMKRPGFTMIIWLARQIVIALPAYWLLTKVLGFGIESIWWATFGIILLSTLVTLAYVMRVFRKFSTT